MSKSKRGGGQWRRRQEKDPYVQMARRDGWRSRAVFKLQQILDKEKLLRPGMVCIDLGAAPGGWSQYVSHMLKGRARIIALDLLEMDALPEVEFIQGDFADDAILETLLDRLGNDKADLVMSDMAPNISGNKAVDQPRTMYLVELALDLAKQTLRRNGAFICKLFQGEGTDALIKDARDSFGTVKAMKPKASRSTSREIYLVALKFRG